MREWREAVIASGVRCEAAINDARASSRTREAERARRKDGKKRGEADGVMREVREAALASVCNARLENETRCEPTTSREQNPQRKK